MFKQLIQLPSEETSRWSIPCCSTLRGRGIQLPEDSDHEEEDIAPFHIESTNFLQHPANLSRNPFARVEEAPPKIVLPVETLVEVTEELTSRHKYENEPDWTEMHQEDESSTLNTQEEDEQNDEQEERAEEGAEEEEEIPKKEEKIPQIEKEVLHLLPLPQLSNELPPTMIHKKPSFEKSMYGEQPLMSTTKTTSRFSRFSMTEEDFLALKKQEASKVEPVKEEQALTVATSVSTDPLSTTQVTQRGSSIVTNAAQSILGDKLDDFTEKLAYIKKNIIMSIDSDDDEEADNAEETLKKIALLKNEPSTSSIPSEMPRTLHRRASSLMDVAPTLARFMNQISGSNTEEPASFSPSSLFSALAGPEPSSSRQMMPADEELFDFTKVIEIGKNMRSFSEGFVGNGIRMLNDVATRIKTSSEEEEEEKETQDENWINDSYI